MTSFSFNGFLFVPETPPEPVWDKLPEPKPPRERGHRLHITIRRNADGIERTHTLEDWFAWSEEGDEYYYSDGNAGCDCNREMDFCRAGGEPVPDDPQCGDGRFTIVKITQDDDPTVLYGEE